MAIITETSKRNIETEVSVFRCYVSCILVRSAQLIKGSEGNSFMNAATKWVVKGFIICGSWGSSFMGRCERKKCCKAPHLQPPKLSVMNGMFMSLLKVMC